MNRFRVNSEGFTLVELVITILVGAIILPASYLAINSVFMYFSAPDYVVKAKFYAEKKLAEFTRYPYSNIPVTDETAYETIAGSYDDTVKKYFYWKWKVKYVDPYDTTNPYFAELPNETTPVPDYKIITVTIKALDDSEYAVPLLVTNRPKQ